jgi:hypothetical protein
MGNFTDIQETANIKILIENLCEVSSNVAHFLLLGFFYSFCDDELLDLLKAISASNCLKTLCLLTRISKFTAHCRTLISTALSPHAEISHSRLLACQNIFFIFAI